MVTCQASMKTKPDLNWASASQPQVIKQTQMYKSIETGKQKFGRTVRKALHFCITGNPLAKKKKNYK